MIRYLKMRGLMRNKNYCYKFLVRKCLHYLIFLEWRSWGANGFDCGKAEMPKQDGGSIPATSTKTIIQKGAVNGTTT